MNALFKSLVSTAVSAGLLGLSACAALAASRHDGYVADIVTTDVQLCFTGEAAPAVGDEVQLIRTVRVGDPKQSTLAERNVGVARITAPRREGCFAATVTKGQVQRYDHVKLSHRD